MHRALASFSILMAVTLAVPAAAVAGPREDLQDLAAAIAAGGYTRQAAQIERAVASVSDEQLAEVYGDQDLARVAESFWEAMAAKDRAREILSEASGSEASGSEASGSEASPAGGNPSPFEHHGEPGYPPLVDKTDPGLGFPSTFYCPQSPDYSDADSFIIATYAVETARTAYDVTTDILAAANRGCDLVVVGIGVGGNPQSAACIVLDIAVAVADAVITVAELVVRHIGFCDDLIEATMTEVNYKRLDHINLDLGHIDFFLDEHAIDLDDHDEALQIMVSVHDTALSTHDDDLKARLATHDSDLKTALATHDSDIKAQLDRMEGKLDLVLKTQLEDRLSRHNHGSLLGVMYTDRINDVCAAAQEAIDDVIAAGYYVNPRAQLLHDDGVGLIATDPKKAHDRCRRAYQYATHKATKLQ